MAITIVVITATKKTVIKINAEENNFNASTRNGNVIWKRIVKMEVTKLIVQKGQLLAR